MSMINCKVLRATIAIAAALFAIGLLLQAPRLIFNGEYALYTTLLSGTGLFFIVISPMVMLGTAIISVIPKFARDLELCEH